MRPCLALACGILSCSLLSLFACNDPISVVLGGFGSIGLPLAAFGLVAIVS